MASEYRCVGCGFKVKSLFIQYSPGNILLHRPKVYRHVLYNEINQETVNIHVLVDVLTTNLAFIFSFAIAAKGLLNEILLGILISSYFKIFLLAMLVWEFPVSVIFVIDILVLTSNSMALRGQTFNY
ncbi:hypothetical protein Bca52824_062066 [Brassica carinata]|uniref:Protein ARV n=1 Tax=Brassica carinata TaxID=52824 RepID=A0A8X7U7U8_BRACI|nr:hypothetical protein Bca52824_062066 [Brassica carinata]